jgi:glycosidase
VLVRLVLFALLGSACAPSSRGDDVRADERTFLVAYRPLRMAPGEMPPPAGAPTLVGSWDNWQRHGDQRWKDESDQSGTLWRTLEVTVAPGRWQYAIVVGDRVLTDENNPRSTFGADPLGVSMDPEGTELSERVIADPTGPLLAFDPPAPTATGIVFAARFLRGIGGPKIDPGSIAVTLRSGGATLPAPTVSVDGNRITARADSLTAGKYTLELHASALDGRTADAAFASAFVEDRAARALGDAMVYQIMIDRFRGPSGALAAPPTPADRAGGTLDGVRAAIEAGYFDQLGVTTLWLSPVYQNPTGYFTGRDGHLSTAYHGYWPSQPRAVDPLLGGEAALDALIASAHARGLRVLLDAVPHHVHEQHPYYREHSHLAPPSWFLDGPSACVCGATNCDWGAHLEDCWFTTYLPNLDLRQGAIDDLSVDDLVWWQDRFELDGFRFDAIPMMPRPASRRMISGLRADVTRSDLDGLLVGEIYTGPGDDGRAQIRAYLGRSLDGLDSAFDFPLMWAIRDVIAHGESGFQYLESEIEAGDAAWANSGSTIARIVGNHDTTRFLSEAYAGSAVNNDPWQDPPPQPLIEAPYLKHRLGMALLLTLPGIPVIYYGDELGLAGANDPDSRRVAPDLLAPASLPAVERDTQTMVAKLGRLRRCLPALRRPSQRMPLAVEPDRLVALHLPPDGEKEAAIVGLSRLAFDTQVQVHGVPDGTWHEVLSGKTFVSSGGALTIDLPATAPVVLIPEASSCVE